MPSVRAKFVVESKTQLRNDACNIELRPVYADENAENKAFYKWTPSGEIKLLTLNQAAAEAFVVGKSYYVDFTPAE
jgi:hypothetical protein